MSTDRKMEFFGAGWRSVENPGEAHRSPIIDAHFHIFPRFATGSDPESAALTLKLWQYHVRDFTDFWRKADGKPVKERLLDYPSDDIHEMPEVNFRMAMYGKAELTVDSVDYYMAMYPPNLENLEATPERMIAEMDMAGVDMGVLQSDHVYGSCINDYYAKAMERDPNRFLALAQIHEPEADQPAQLERLERAVREQGARGSTSVSNCSPSTATSITLTTPSSSPSGKRYATSKFRSGGTWMPAAATGWQASCSTSPRSIAGPRHTRISQRC